MLVSGGRADAGLISCYVCAEGETASQVLKGVGAGSVVIAVDGEPLIAENADRLIEKVRESGGGQGGGC